MSACELTVITRSANVTNLCLSFRRQTVVVLIGEEGHCRRVYMQGKATFYCKPHKILKRATFWLTTRAALLKIKRTNTNEQSLYDVTDLLKDPLIVSDVLKLLWI